MFSANNFSIGILLIFSGYVDGQLPKHPDIRSLGNADIRALYDKHYANYQLFLTKHKRHEYEKLEHLPEHVRLTAYAQSVQTIQEHNARYQNGEETYFLGANHLSDWPMEEFLKLHGLQHVEISDANETRGAHILETNNLPVEVDWVKSGAVTPVKHQRRCGGCYSFAATGALEGQQKIKTGRLLSLSEQNILDCSDNDGCTSGLCSNAFDYIRRNGGVDTERSYPYEGRVGQCRYNASNSGGALRSFARLPKDEVLLKAAVARIGPLAVGVYATLPEFKNYKGGIFNTAHCPNDTVNHAVLLVGYGIDYIKEKCGKPRRMEYWRIKNSWGPHWGEDGYMRIAANHGNMCGIAVQASYPIV